MRSFLLSILTAVLGLAALAPEAGASDVWCDTDPILIVTTPQGSQVPIYVNTGAQGAQHLPAAQLAKMGYTASSAQSGKGTAVTVSVTVADDAFATSFPTRAGVSTGPFLTGQVYGQAEGTSGHTMQIHFNLPVQ